MSYENLPVAPDQETLKATLDEKAEKIRLSEDYYERQNSIEIFKMICFDTQGRLNPALEAAKRGVALVNHLPPMTSKW